MTDTHKIQTINFIGHQATIFSTSQLSILMEWMRNSVFCLHPPGDSMARKSFYDSIICGCIPVIFQPDFDCNVTYPFASSLPYSSFSVKISREERPDFISVLLSYSDSKIRKMRENLLKVLPYLQYNDFKALDIGEDANTMILREIMTNFNINKTVS